MKFVINHCINTINTMQYIIMKSSMILLSCWIPDDLSMNIYSDEKQEYKDKSSFVNKFFYS